MEVRLVVLECKVCDRSGKGMGLEAPGVILRSLNFDLWVIWSQRRPSGRRETRTGTLKKVHSDSSEEHRIGCGKPRSKETNKKTTAIKYLLLLRHLR